MPKLSVLIPSRNEKYLFPTIHDCFAKMRGHTEVVVTLDGYWPEGWKEITDKYPDLHTVHHGEARGLRPAINSGAASAISRGADYLMKLDAHCLLDEGFDVTLLAEIEPNWIVVPRRKRLDPDAWTVTETHKTDIDYHYLSFPDDPADFGGPGLNGKVWEARAKERRDKPEYDLDSEMSSQGSAWVLASSYFQQLELMDDKSYGPFWNEAQELFLKCWLSGGRGVINKRTFYAHLHKGRTHGRGYHLPESWLKQGATFTKLWMFNEAWPKQTLPFEWLIDHFWPVPTWPENWRDILYAERKPRAIGAGVENVVRIDGVATGEAAQMATSNGGSLRIHSARYGVLGAPVPFRDHSVDVAERVRSLIKNDALDIIVNNSTLTPGQNPYRGKKKVLLLTYGYSDRESVTVERIEKDWLIIGQPQRDIGSKETAELVANRDGKFCPYCGQRFTLVNGFFPVHAASREDELKYVNPPACKGSTKEYVHNPAYKHLDVKSGAYVPAEAVPISDPPRTATALNDYLIRKFSISPQRLRAPMPIELRDFHRDDLAKLFAELGFSVGCEVGVAEAIFSEVILQANPSCRLLLVDPWHSYSSNPQNKSKERHEFAYNETLRRTKPYPNVKIDMRYSMDAVRDVPDGSLDFVYLDAHHSYPFIMSDLIFWSQKVRSGGIVSGDDVYKLDEARWGAGPAEAVYDYTRAMRINPWWLIAARKSVDFFFVKP